MRQHHTHTPILVSLGRLQIRKRIDLLIQACADLPEALKPELMIIGDGPDRERLQSIAAEKYPRTKFHGAKTGADLDALLAQADLFVLPGTGGLAIQQAMAAGLPIIAALGDGTQNDLVRQSNGWLVEPDSLTDLSRVLQIALSYREQLQMMGMESYRIVKEEINIESMADVFVQVFRSVMTL